MNRVERVLTNYKVTIVAIGAAILGFIFIVIEANTAGIVSNIFGGVGSTTLSIGLVVLIYELWLRRSMIAEFLDAANLRGDLVSTGVREIRTFGAIDLAKFLKEKGDIEISFTYGRSWSASHADQVIRNVHQSKSRVSVIVIDPEAPIPMLDFYGNVFGTDASGLKDRINESINMWKDAAQKIPGLPAGTVRIEGISRPMSYTYYRVGNQMWLVFSPRQGGRASDMPALRCIQGTGRSDQGLFDWVVNDTEGCRRSNASREIWRSE
jgi:hypothetical protein